MTQVATNTNKQQEDKGRFVQFPIHLIYGCPELTRDDRFVLLAIMGEYWTKGPHKLSYRDIASLSRVPVSLLSSSKGKDGKPDKEGIVDRLVRLGLIKVTLGKELKSGRVTGNAQTFVEIEYKKIWQDNVAYCEDRRLPENKEVEYQPVSYTNRLKTPKPVRIENEPVPNTNESVSYTNRPVPNTNNPVRDASSKVTPNITDIKITEDSKDNVSIDTADETAKLTDQEISQEVVNANTSSPTTDERPDTPTSSNLRNNLRVITPDTSLSPSSMEDIKDVEQISRTSDTVLPIAPVTTRKRVSKNKTSSNQSPSQKPLLELNKQETYLSEKAREVWKAWCEMPWNKDINPPLTSTAAAHCETLSKVEITKEIMFKVLNFARKNDINGFYKNKPLQLGHIVKEYPRWRSATQEIPETKEDKLQSYKPMDLAARNAYNRERYSKKPTTEQPSNVVKLPVTAIAR